MKTLIGEDVPEVAIPNSFHAVVHALQYGSERVLDLWFKHVSGPPGSASELAEMVVNEIVNNDLPIFQSSCQFVDCTVYDVGSVPYTEGTYSFGPGVYGTGTNELDAAPADAVRVTLHDGLVYKGGKPGFSLFGQAAANIANGGWVSGLITIVGAMVDRFLALPPGTSGAVYVLANKHLRANKVQLNMTVPATGATVQPTTRTIRRRNVGKGRLGITKSVIH